MFQKTAIRLMMLTCICLQIGCSSTRSKPLHWTAKPPATDIHPLDHEARKFRSGLVCPSVMTHKYAGDALAYHRPVKVNPFFRDRLQQFELVVQSVAQKHYQTSDVTIRHWGTFNCRAIRGKKKLSEHAFANAIDVMGFDIHKGDQDIRIVVEKHWWSRDSRSAFMHDLVRALASRPDIFRGILGPGDPAHEDHLHLDAGPYRYIDVHVPG